MYSRCCRAFVQIRMPMFVFRKINCLETVENSMIRYESCLDNLCIYPTESFFHYLVNQYLVCLIQLLRLVDQLFPRFSRNFVQLYHIIFSGAGLVFSVFLK